MATTNDIEQAGLIFNDALDLSVGGLSSTSVSQYEADIAALQSDFASMLTSGVTVDGVAVTPSNLGTLNGPLGTIAAVSNQLGLLADAAPNALSIDAATAAQAQATLHNVELQILAEINGDANLATALAINAVVIPTTPTTLDQGFQTLAAQAADGPTAIANAQAAGANLQNIGDVFNAAADASIGGLNANNLPQFDNDMHAVATGLQHFVNGGGLQTAQQNTSAVRPAPMASAIILERRQRTAKVVYKGGVLPLSKTDQGKVIFDWSACIPGKIGDVAKSAYQAFTLPGRVMSGEVPMPQPGSTDPNAYTSLIPEATNFATAFSPLNPAVRAGSRMIPGATTNVTRPAQPAPSVDKLFQVGGEQMDQFRDLPIRYSPAHIGDLAGTIEGRLIDKGIFRDDAPGIYNSLDLMRQSAGAQPSGATAVITPASLHSLRRNISNKFGRASEHQLAPAIAQEELDKFIASPPEGAVLARPPPGPLTMPATIGHNQGPRFSNEAAGRDAGALFQQALGNLAGGYRGESFDELRRAIDLRTAAANSGRNLDNTTRQKITGVLLDPRREKAFVPSEVSGLEQAVYGDPTTNRYRDVSKMLGGGGGLGALISSGIGQTLGGFGAQGLGLPWWAGAGAPIGPAVGRFLGSRSAARTQAALNAVDEATRMRTPYYQSLPPLPPQVPGLVGRDAIAHAMMLGAIPPERLYVSPNREDEQ